MAVVRCPLCSVELSADHRYCSACGAALTAGDAPPTGPWQPNTGVTLSVPQPATAGRGRFPPGHLLAKRYRVVTRLGRGGMGEVYSAEDLRLGGPVALKFLPASLSHDADRLQRLHHEVRVARQVTHPNVCRVF